MSKIMNKQEFVTYIATQHDCTKVEAEKAIDIFTSSVIDAIGQGNEISLVGFGNFSISKVAARGGRNPRTGEALQVKSYNQVKFKTGQKLKDACNK
jgi:DNA-binding protein HU-beta